MIPERHDRSAAPGAPHNLLLAGDNLAAMDALVAERPGSIDLVYIDPPYASGADYASSANEGAPLARPAFRDTWDGGVAAYLAMLRPRLERIWQLLAPEGSLFVHVGWQVNAHVRLLCDEIFGAGRLVDEIVWHYQTSGGAPAAALIKNHALIYHYARGDRWTFNQLREPWPERTLRKWQRDEEGRIYRVQNRFGKRYYIDPAGKRIDDVWEFTLASRSHERTLYPTQKPEALLDGIVRMASDPGDTVADFFCGSGTTLACAEKLGRRWLGCDAGRLAIQTTRRRLLAIPGRAPFEIRQAAGLEAAHPAPCGAPELDVRLEHGSGGWRARVAGLAYPAPGGLPPRLARASWPEWLDEWAVDWDFDGDAFRPHFGAFCTRRGPSLALASDPFAGSPGVVRIRAVDVFGQEGVWVASPVVS